MKSFTLRSFMSYSGSSNEENLKKSIGLLTRHVLSVYPNLSSSEVHGKMFYELLSSMGVSLTPTARFTELHPNKNTCNAFGTIFFTLLLVSFFGIVYDRYQESSPYASYDPLFCDMVISKMGIIFNASGHSFHELFDVQYFDPFKRNALTNLSGMNWN